MVQQSEPLFKASLSYVTLLFLKWRIVQPSAGYVDFDTTTGTQPGAWRNEVAGDANLIPLGQQGSGNMYSRDAKEVRQMYQEYFTSSHGQVSWQ